MRKPHLGTVKIYRVEFDKHGQEVGEELEQLIESYFHSTEKERWSTLWKRAILDRKDLEAGKVYRYYHNMVY